MLALAVFGIKNSSINAAVELIILFLLVIWLALVYWTYADARRRIADPLLVGCATAASLFPFVGTIVYMIVRPPEYLDDVRERELEIQAAEARLVELGYQVCPYCDFEVEKDFLRCPNCMRKLKDPCTNCGKPLDPMWKICPFCEAEIGSVAPAPRRARRRRDGAAEQPVAGATVRAERAGGSAPTPAPAERGGPSAG
jgi:Double zinc ribbon